MKRRWWSLLLLPALGLALWPLRRWLTPEAIAAWTPRQTWLAAAALLGLYVVKGLTAALPITALEAAGGLLFPFPAALALGLCGAAAAQAAPYAWGRCQRDRFAALESRYPRLAALEADSGRQVFLLRLAGVLPGDLMSLYLGAAGTPWRTYFLGGLLGTFPRVLSATVLGAALWEPGGRRFWASCVFGWALTGMALLLWGRAWALGGRNES